MVLADKILFLAGPPDVFADQKTDPFIRRGKLVPAKAGKAFEGKKAAALYAFSSEDGKKLAEYKLESPPVFDGMIAANGRLYISTRDGRLVCMGKGFPKNK